MCVQSLLIFEDQTIDRLLFSVQSRLLGDLNASQTMLSEIRRPTPKGILFIIPLTPKYWPIHAHTHRSTHLHASLSLSLSFFSFKIINYSTITLQIFMKEKKIYTISLALSLCLRSSRECVAERMLMVDGLLAFFAQQEKVAISIDT